MSDNEIAQESTAMVQEHTASGIVVPWDAPAVELIMVTPELASTWLASRRRNRSIRWNVVEAIARDITGARWQLNGDTIKFGTDELLDDGQHRLHSVVKSGIAVPMLVVHGITEEARHTVDSGMIRGYRDILQMAGYVNSAALAAVTRRMWYWDKGAYVVSGKAKDLVPTRQELDAYLAKHDAELTSAVSSFAADTHRGVMMAKTTLATVAVILSRIDAEAAGTFLTGFITSADLPSGSPILMLRNRLIRVEEYARHRRAVSMDQEERRALVFVAWNHWRDGKTVSNILLPKGGLTSKNYPIPR